jgi:hypothetical protein
MFRVAKSLGRPWDTLPYVILGDDVLVGDPRVGERYVSLIQELGVEVSPEKTYISSRMCEFAKRYLRHGREISPFPVSAVSNEYDVPGIVSSLAGETRKGYFPKDGIPGAVRRLMKIKRPKLKERELNEIEAQAFHCEAATNFFSGVITASEFTTLLCDHHSGRGVSEWTGEILIQTALVELLTESLGAEEGSFISEFDRVERQLYQLPAPVVVAPLRACIPVLALGPDVDSHVRKMERDLSLVNWTKGEWKELIKLIYNPFSRYSFDSSPARIRARVSYRLGAKVRAFFEDPVLLATVNSRRLNRPFTRAGLVLSMRALGPPAVLGQFIPLDESGGDEPLFAKHFKSGWTL